MMGDKKIVDLFSDSDSSTSDDIEELDLKLLFAKSDTSAASSEANSSSFDESSEEEEEQKTASNENKSLIFNHTNTFMNERRENEDIEPLKVEHQSTHQTSVCEFRKQPSPSTILRKLYSVSVREALDNIQSTDPDKMTSPKLLVNPDDTTQNDFAEVASGTFSTEADQQDEITSPRSKSVPTKKLKRQMGNKSGMLVESESEDGIDFLFSKQRVSPTSVIPLPDASLKDDEKTTPKCGRGRGRPKKSDFSKRWFTYLIPNLNNFEIILPSVDQAIATMKKNYAGIEYQMSNINSILEPDIFCKSGSSDHHSDADEMETIASSSSRQGSLCGSSSRRQEAQFSTSSISSFYLQCMPTNVANNLRMNFYIPCRWCSKELSPSAYGMHTLKNHQKFLRENKATVEHIENLFRSDRVEFDRIEWWCEEHEICFSTPLDLLDHRERVTHAQQKMRRQNNGQFRKSLDEALRVFSENA